MNLASLLIVVTRKTLYNTRTFSLQLTARFSTPDIYAVHCLRQPEDSSDTTTAQRQGEGKGQRQRRRQQRMADPARSERGAGDKADDDADSESTATAIQCGLGDAYADTDKAVQDRFNTPPPDGGLQAWLQVLGGFAIFFNTWGLIATYGVFQAYYLTLPRLPHSASEIAWIGAVYSTMTFVTGFFSGPIFDRGFLRSLLVLGSFLLVFAFMMISLCDTLWQLILAQGLCAGIGSGVLFSTVSPLLTQWWRQRLGLANGVTASGAAIAGIIYPIAFRKLVPSVGFPWAVRILGFIALVTLLPAVAFLRRRVKPGRPRAWLDRTVLTDAPFLAYMAAATLSVIGLYSMLFFLSSFVQARRLTSESMAFYILPILNAGSLFGRIVPNMLADKYGALNVAPVGAFICSLLIFCMIAVDSEAGVIVMAVIFGFFSAIFIALPGVASALLIKNKSLVGTRMGMSLAFAGMGALAGGPGGGSVMSYGQGGDWNALWVYGGVASGVAGLLYVLARHLHLREMRRERENCSGTVMRRKGQRNSRPNEAVGG